MNFRGIIIRKKKLAMSLLHHGEQVFVVNLTMGIQSTACTFAPSRIRRIDKKSGAFIIQIPGQIVERISLMKFDFLTAMLNSANSLGQGLRIPPGGNAPSIFAILHKRCSGSQDAASLNAVTQQSLKCQVFLRRSPLGKRFENGISANGKVQNAPNKMIRSGAKNRLPYSSNSLIKFDHYHAIRPVLKSHSQSNYASTCEWLDKFGGARWQSLQPSANLRYEPCFAAWVAKRTSLRHRGNVHDVFSFYRITEKIG